jgi:type II secretion system protein N
VLRWVGYGAFFLFAFLLFSYWTFPYERLRDWIIQQVEYPPGPGGRRQPSGYQLEIVDLSPSWFTGAELTGVRLIKLPDEPDGRPVDVTFERIEARASLWSLLLGDTSVSFDMEVAGGSIAGEYTEGETETHLEASIDGVNLRQLQLLRGLAGLPFTGTVNSTIDVTVANKLENTQGEVDLQIKGLSVGNGKAKLKLPKMSEGLTIDRMNLGDLELEIDVDRGVATFKELAARGEDAELTGSGTLRLLKPMRMSRLDMLVRVLIRDTYRNKSDRTRALFSLMDFNPKLRAAKTPDDALQWRVQGSFGGGMNAKAAGRAKR